ncbi:unnamed protein product [Hyaloperonospora brassicae]|uniref:Protein kinase domain-containing protein n=1 Tax=Hyaloperonospora brassicae TaxID=162125 RepID=A0AAV0UTU4_HYABA|nr:unnamed protein product [Hyaloperonospora brassicae]
MSRASIGDYVVTRKLGSGSFAVVYKGYHRTSKRPVAIKALSLYKLNGKLLANLEMEVAIMRQIDHPNVVKLYEIQKTDKHMYLVLEYCAGGDLQQYMRRHQQPTRQPTRQRADELQSASSSLCLPEAVARHFLRELATGMQCLWHHNLIHRDLKPQNLLLVEDSPTSALKIADFGFARHLATASMAETLCGSPLYMAPEILKFQKYDAKADLWSVGTILFEMVAGRPPFGGANHVQLLANIERQPLRFPPTLQLSRGCRHLLVALLQRKPALRLGFAEFFADPFVDLQSLTVELDTAEVMRRSSNLSLNTSIREEKESEEDKLLGRWGISTASGGGRDTAHEGYAATSPASCRKSNGIDVREVPASNEVSSSSRFACTAPPAMTRQSRSGNLEVMETAFARASSGSKTLRRSSSSRLARSRRASSSGNGCVADTSPKLSPQMSPHILPSPSPRINPFKQLSESPPGVAAVPYQHRSPSGSYRADASFATCPIGSAAIVATKQKSVGGGGGHTLDSSGEYVLVDGLTDKFAPSGQSSHPYIHRTSTGKATNAVPVTIDLAATSLPTAEPCNGHAGSLSRECSQQLFDVVVLRVQAIASIADQLWALSAASGTSSGSADECIGELTGEDWSPQRTICKSKSLSTSRERGASDGDFSSNFAMSLSLSSSLGGNNLLVDDENGDDDEDEDERRNNERHYICAAEALALYVTCLRLLQHVALYLRQDPASYVSRGSVASSESRGTLLQRNGTSLKASMAFLSDRLTHYLGRVEQCKALMKSAAISRAPLRAATSQVEMLYTHAIRIGRQGAIREVLGHTRAAHDHYLQSLLLLESLMMDTSSASAGELAVGDQKNVNDVLRALELRLKNVRTTLEKDEGSNAVRSHQRSLQHPPWPHF